MSKNAKKHKEYTEAIANFHAIVPPCTEEEEEEWQAIISKPHVQQALRRMAQEAKNGEKHGKIQR